MNRRSVIFAALAALALPTAAALASTPAAAPSMISAFAREIVPAPSEVATELVALGVGIGSGSPYGTAEVRYRPRMRERPYYAHSRGPTVASPVQFHAGFFDPDGEASTAFVAGFRAGPQVDPHVQVGLGADWMHKSENATSIISEQPGPGGTTIVTEQQLTESSSNLIPIMAFIQVGADDRMPVIPYFGIGGGYQLLFLSATDFNTGSEFDGTFGGWAWQVWGGLAIPLSGQARLTGEVFVNNGEAHRDVDGPPGITYRETVNLDGTGARFGVNFGF